MKVVIFCHSLVSDWNHGNAHFLRGVARELLACGHTVSVYEPEDGWSRSNLRRQHGLKPERDFAEAFPALSSRQYRLTELDLEQALDHADLVLVHEWNDPTLVARIGHHHERTRNYRLLFHDTHHRAVSAPEQMRGLDLSGYDGVLAFGEVIRRLYLERGWTARAWTWHEAADTRLFTPHHGVTRSDDLVWIGNWGDGERTRELHELLLVPARRLRLSGTVHGVRYPWRARLAVRHSRLRYGGWLPNHRVPAVFARHRFTVHIPRRPYVQALPGIPTIRVFEALASGIPLICSAWEDAEQLFTPGRDYLVADNRREMQTAMRAVQHDRALATGLADHGRATIMARHTCMHRVQELLTIAASLQPPASETPLRVHSGQHTVLQRVQERSL